jgi:hypothetical protein
MFIDNGPGISHKLRRSGMCGCFERDIEQAFRSYGAAAFF